MANEAQIISDLSLYKDVVVPLGATFIGGLFGILSGLLIAAKSEKFRRLAMWEPYAKDLWSKQVDLICEILVQGNKALNSAIFMFDVFNADKEKKLIYASILNEQLGILVHFLQNSIFLPQHL